MTTLTYLSFDSVVTGVGASQVRPYVERLADRGLHVTLHTFEPAAPPAHVADSLSARGVDWVAHPFGRYGAAGGLARVARGATHVRRVRLLHARGDPAAASAMLGGAQSWVWDMRAFWREQRLSTGALRAGSPEERVMRIVERRAAYRSNAVITLTAAAAETLGTRFGAPVAEKCRVVPTCVDLARFWPEMLPPRPIRFLLSGSINTFYDVPTMIRLVEAVRRREAAELRVLRPEATPWDQRLLAAGADVSSVAHESMAQEVRAAHAGLSVCRLDAGPSLRSALPTKIAEFLASGRPVVVNAGLGDMDELIARHGCGVVIDGLSDDAIDRAAAALMELLGDAEVVSRCRAAAERHFDIEQGVDALTAVYESLGT